MSFIDYMDIQLSSLLRKMFLETLFTIGDITFSFLDLIVLVCLLFIIFCFIWLLASFVRLWIEDRRVQKRLDKAKEG